MSTHRETRRAELDALMETFATDGWKLFTTEVDQMFISRLKGSIDECNNGEQWKERQGELKMLQAIRNYAAHNIAEYDNFDDLDFEDEPSNLTNPLEE